MSTTSPAQSAVRSTFRALNLNQDCDDASRARPSTGGLKLCRPPARGKAMNAPEDGVTRTRNPVARRDPGVRASGGRVAGENAILDVEDARAAIDRNSISHPCAAEPQSPVELLQARRANREQEAGSQTSGNAQGPAAGSSRAPDCATRTVARREDNLGASGGRAAGVAIPQNYSGDSTMAACAAKRQAWQKIERQVTDFSAAKERDLGEFLAMVELSDHLELLVKKEMDLDILRQCTVDDLVQLGLSRLDAAKIYYTRMREGSNPTPTASASDHPNSDNMCTICLESNKVMKPFPNPECPHEFCEGCLDEMMAFWRRNTAGPAQWSGLQGCPMCRRPVTGMHTSPVDPRDVAAETQVIRPRYRVVKASNVRTTASINSGVLGQVAVGEFVEIIEEVICDGHRRIRIGEGAWMSRVTAQGNVLVDGPGAKVSVSFGIQRRNIACGCCLIVFLYAQDKRNASYQGHGFTYSKCAMLVFFIMLAVSTANVQQTTRTGSCEMAECRIFWSSFCTLFILPIVLCIVVLLLVWIVERAI